MLLLRVSLVAAALVPVTVHAQSSGRPTLESRFAGTWRLESVGSARSARNRAVDRATEEMSFLTRGIARRRLRNGTPLHRTIRITGDGSTFRVRVGDYDLDFAADGRSHPITDPFGNDLDAKQSFRNGRLVQVMKSDDATLTHSLALSEDGRRLTLTVRIASHHLPGDVVFRLRYRRS